MSSIRGIVPVRGKWRVNITKIDGVSLQFDIDQDATVRKLYTSVRPVLRSKWNFNNSFQLYVNSSPLTKDNRKLCNAGLYNGITLFVEAQSNPYSWDLFIKLGADGYPNTVTIDENKTRKELHEKVKQAVHGGTNQPICIKNVAKDEVPDDNTKLRDADCMYDGATLVSEIRAPWSLMVLISGGRGGSQTLTVTVPADAKVSDLYREVESRLPNKEIRLSIGTAELRKERHGADSVSQYAKHTSSVVVLFRTKGGSDCNAQIQMLHNNATTLTSCDLPCCCQCEEEMWSHSVGSL